MNIKSIKYTDFDIGKIVAWFAEFINFTKRGILLSVLLGLFSGITSYMIGNLIPMYTTLAVVLILGGLVSIDNSGMFEFTIKLSLITLVIVHLFILKPLTTDKSLEFPVTIYTTNYKNTDQNGVVTDKIDVRIFNKTTNELVNTITYDKSDELIVRKLYNGVNKVKEVTQHTMFINYSRHYEYIR